MKKFLLGLGLLLLVFLPTLLLADDPAAQTFLVDRYSNNAGPGTPMDQILRLINVGVDGTPLTSPVGDVCANIYVFDANQEMVSCCSCRVTPNELVTASVANQLTGNPLTSVSPIAGVIKIVPTVAGSGVCSPTAPSGTSDATLLSGSSTHVEVSGPLSYITETHVPVAPLGPDEASFLFNACFYVKYLGSGAGRGSCTCTGSNVNGGTTTFSISGTISGPGGNGASVNLTGSSTATVTADASGNYIFPGLGPGSYTVTPGKAGFTYSPASASAVITTVNSANVTGLNFSTVAYGISGTISGAGGSGATLNLTGTSSASATADASGNYSFSGLPNGSYTVTPSKTGFTFNPASQQAAINNASVAGVNFASGVSYSISGTIGGVGGSGATVSLTGASSATVAADAAGNYSFTGLQNGSYNVTPSQAGFTFTPASQPATINNASVTGMNFGTVTFGISGAISGAGGNGASVILTGPSTAVVTTDAAGNFSFIGLQNGFYTVTPSKAGFAFTPASQLATVNGLSVAGINFSTATYSISGTISGAGGSGATVNLTGASTATVTADAAGNYSFTGLQNGSYTVTAGKAGFTFAPASQPATVNNASVTAMNFSTVTYSISGTISGAGGNAATVTLSGGAVAVVTADASGNYTFTGLTNGAYVVTPSQPGFSFSPANQSVTVSSANVTSVSFSTVTYSISGTISGAGGNGATVNLTGAATATVTADTAGNYSFTGLQNGSYTVTPSKAGFAFTPASQAVTVSSSNVAAISFSTVTYSISGTVSGAGSSGASVNLAGAATATVTADAGGNYSFSGLQNGSYTVTPSKAGFTFTPASQAVTVSNANVTAMNFSTVTYSISGMIGGTGGPGATVNLSGTSAASVTADASGNYSFTGLQSGSYTVSPGNAGFAFTPASQPVAVGSSNVAGINFSTVTYSISGTIGGAGGNGATVSLTGTSSASVTADAAGNYSFTGLPGGSYTVVATKAGFAFTPASQPVTVSNANVAGINFGTVTYSISGTISGAGGNGATVSLAGTSNATVTADAAGNYSFTGLQNGSYTVTPSKAGFSFTPASQPVTVSSSNVAGINFSTVTFSISGTIGGTGGNGATVNLTGASAASVTADASGNYSFTGLQNGSYTVTPVKAGFSFGPASQSATVNNANVTAMNFATVTYSISGTIGGAGGNGATIALSGAASATATADASGNYTFSGLMNGSYVVTPSHAGFNFSPASQSVTLNSANVTAINFGTVTYSISGTISGAGGAGATVSLAGASTASVTADAAGNYSFSGLQNGSYSLTPSKAGFTFTPASQPVTVSNSNMAVVNFGTVTYSISGTISGAGGTAATVNLTGAATGSVTADASGNYSFSGLQNGSYTVTPVKTGFAFSPASQPATVSSANVTGVNFGTFTYSISGTISGAGGSGATVKLTGASTATVTADASGNYSFTGLQSGSYTVKPSNSGFSFTPASQAATVNNANVTGVNFGTVTYSISGTISGAGGSGATVSLIGAATATTTADASGSYSFTGLQNGAYTVTPNKSGFSFSPAQKNVAVSGSNASGVNFSMVTYSISGTISGAGCSGATVSLTGTSTATATTDSSGNYSFSGLQNGSYTVTPSKSGFNFSPTSQSVTLNGASASGVNFITLAYTISGKVTGGTGVTVSLSGAATATTTTDSSGKYTFANLNAGSYTVTPSMSGFTFSPASHSVTVSTANVTGVNFTLFSYSISGTISGSGGNGAWVTLSGSASATVIADDDGNYSFTGLPNGSYTITPSNSSYYFTPASAAVAVNGASVSAVNFASAGQLAIDKVVSADNSSYLATITSPTFSLGYTNELLLAFISTDAATAPMAISSVSSSDGILKWSLVQRTNTQMGTSEIWGTLVPYTLSNISVSAALPQSVAYSMTVVTFTGVDASSGNFSSAIGATGSNNANPGAPTASLTTTRNNSWVFGVGNDWNSATARTLDDGQTMVHQLLAARGDTFWVQSQTSTTPLAGTVVTIDDTAPTGDLFNLSICEILPAQ